MQVLGIVGDVSGATGLDANALRKANATISETGQVLLPDNWRSNGTSAGNTLAAAVGMVSGSGFAGYALDITVESKPAAVNPAGADSAIRAVSEVHTNWRGVAGDVAEGIGNFASAVIDSPVLFTVGLGSTLLSVLAFAPGYVGLGVAMIAPTVGQFCGQAVRGLYRAVKRSMIDNTTVRAG